MDAADDPLEKVLPERRFAVCTCVVALIRVWALSSHLKGTDQTPAHLNRVGIIADPATLIVVIASCLASLLGLRRQGVMGSLPGLLLYCGAMLSLMEAESGYRMLCTTGGRMRGTRTGAWRDPAGLVDDPTSGRVTPLGIPAMLLGADHRFLLGMGGSNREQSPPSESRDCSLLLPFTLPCRSLLLLIAPSNAPGLLLIAPFCSLTNGSPKGALCTYLPGLDSLAWSRDALDGCDVRGAF
jgi:hypothetical protein